MGQENRNDIENKKPNSPEADSAKDADAAQRKQEDSAWRPSDDVIEQNGGDDPENVNKREPGDQGVGSAQGGA